MLLLEKWLFTPTHPLPVNQCHNHNGQGSPLSQEKCFVYSHAHNLEWQYQQNVVWTKTASAGDFSKALPDRWYKLFLHKKIYCHWVLAK